ncbi:class I adenylate-forming enzyme family protein [Phaeacidiphilus oryzae]|uniref:class I adenylate-forming enzyme family protein n=1 Tax=Phaeacidiphilus oryzae TaxID=348818 RepID=UPI0005646C2C|nr:AMP-binding protein [Phaeacidiphilus oryzae]
MLTASTLWELLVRRAEADPDTPMLIQERSPGRDAVVTFRQVREAAESAAAGLHAEHGVRHGTRVLWQLPTRIETVLASLALARLGAVQTPVIPLYRGAEVGRILADARPELILTPGRWNDFDYPALYRGLGAEAPVLDIRDDLPAGDPAALPEPPGDPDEVRWIYYTSGTTSAPKGARHTDGTLIAGGLGMARALDMRPADVGSIAFPYAHIGGPDYLVTLLAAGFPALLVERFALPDCLAAYRRNGVTMAGGSTVFYTSLLAEQRRLPAGERLVPTLRILSGGGAPKPPELYFEVREEMGCRLTHGYGMTEAPAITLGRPTDTEEQLAYSDGPPVDGMEVRVDDRGELLLRGPMVCKGYTSPELTAACFDADGWFRTGDLGHLRADGHVVLTGRLKDLIIRKGENISAKEVEDLLYRHPAVGDVAVIGLPDRERGERVCAVVEPAAGAEPLTLAEACGWLREAGLMTQKLPEQLEILPELPRNHTLHKVLKQELRARFGG